MNLGGDVLDTLPAPPEGVQVALLGAAALPGLGGRAAAGGAAAAGGFGAGAQPGAAGVPGYPGDNGPPPATPGYPGVKLPEWLTLPSPSQVMQGIKDGLMITNPVIGIGISIMESVGAGPKDITDANPAIHEGQQGKHVPGHNNFDPTRSPLNADVNPQQLLDGAKSGAYPVIGHGSRGDPVVDSGRNIGVDSNSGDSTSYGTIHSGKKGSHIVPANPNLFGPKK